MWGHEPVGAQLARSVQYKYGGSGTMPETQQKTNIEVGILARMSKV